MGEPPTHGGNPMEAVNLMTEKSGAKQKTPVEPMTASEAGGPPQPHDRSGNPMDERIGVWSFSALTYPSTSGGSW